MPASVTSDAVESRWHLQSAPEAARRRALSSGRSSNSPQAGLGGRVAQQRLGRHHDQRLAELAVDLAAQQVEVVGRRRHVRHLLGTIMNVFRTNPKH